MPARSCKYEGATSYIRTPRYYIIIRHRLLSLVRRESSWPVIDAPKCARDNSPLPSYIHIDLVAAGVAPHRHSPNFVCVELHMYVPDLLSTFLVPLARYLIVSQQTAMLTSRFASFPDLTCYLGTTICSSASTTPLRPRHREHFKPTTVGRLSLFSLGAHLCLYRGLFSQPRERIGDAHAVPIPGCHSQLRTPR